LLRLRGTLPPARRASERPIAIACLRLVTFLPERPLRSVPRLRSCIARLTLLCAFLLYFFFAIGELLCSCPEYDSREDCGLSAHSASVDRRRLTDRSPVRQPQPKGC